MDTPIAIRVNRDSNQRVPDIAINTNTIRRMAKLEWLGTSNWFKPLNHLGSIRDFPILYISLVDPNQKPLRHVKQAKSVAIAIAY